MVALVAKAAMVFMLLAGQAAAPQAWSSDAISTILGTGVVGALLVLGVAASYRGVITWPPERQRMLATIDGLTSVNAHYQKIHEAQTLPALVQTLTYLESSERALEAVVRSIERQVATNEEVARRLEALERRP